MKSGAHFFIFGAFVLNYRLVWVMVLDKMLNGDSLVLKGRMKKKKKSSVILKKLALEFYSESLQMHFR